MTKIQAKPINNQSWILSEWGNRVGVLTNNSQQWTLLCTSSTNLFSNVQEIEQAMNWKIEFEVKEEKEESQSHIQNWPIKHTDPQNINLTPYATYTKLASSSVRFAAGYWGLKFSHGWTAAFCPKVDTINSYDYIGPFTTKLELNTMISQQNQKLEKSTTT